MGKKAKPDTEVALQRIEEARRTAATELDLTVLGLTTLPPEIGSLTALQELHLYGNQLATLPPEIGSLTALQLIDLRDNQLATLPPVVGSLTALQELNLGNNQLATLPPEIGSLTALKWLNLGYNQLTTLPPNIGSLTALLRLYLNNNQLATLPPEIGSLTALQSLNLGNNQLTTVPPEIGSLTALDVLDLGNNQLATVPPEIGSLTALMNLYLERNQLATLPPEIGSLTKLLRLGISGNPLPADLIRLAESSDADALAYIRELATDGLPIREAKLVIVGEGGVGKTCLLRALKGEPFEVQKSTAGVEVAIEALTLAHQAKDEQVRYTMNAWDFAGQDIYRVTHQFFFTRRAIYLVLWNVRAGPTQGAVEFWLNTIKQRVGENARVFVVATHVKTEKTIEDIRRQELKARYGEMIVDFVEVDSRIGFGIPELRSAIAETTAGLAGIEDPVPRKYLDARDRLGESNHKEWSTFGDFADSSGLDADEARRLAFLLSTWGRIVYFGDDGCVADDAPQEGTLANYVVLKPEWLTKAIALILEDDQTKNDNAVLRHDRLPQIWQKHAKEDRPSYARENHPFLMALMEKFSVSFRLGDVPAKATKSLVPQLIRNDRPAKGKAMPWVPGDAPGDQPEAGLTCVLSEAPPPGLVPLMIARTHHLSCDDQHWISGAFLKHARFGEAHMQLADRELRFVARGSYPPHLLGVLSDTAERLLREWEGLNWELAVPCPVCPTVLPPEKPRGHFPTEAIHAYRRENPDSNTMFCNTCRKNVQVERLLSGWLDVASPLIEIGKKLDRMDEKLDQLLLREPLTAAEAAAQFSNFYRLINDQRRLAPSTFSAIYETPSGWFAKLFQGVFRVTLWCENPNGPHPVVSIGSAAKAKPVSGEYLISFDREWVRRWAPLIKWGLFALKAAVPVAGAMLKAGLDEALFKNVEKQLSLGEKAIASLPSGELTATKGPSLDEGLMYSLSGSELREFHATMAEYFKDGKWGDLLYAELPDKSWRWMCKKCREQLSPGPQKSLGE